MKQAINISLNKLLSPKANLVLKKRVREAFTDLIQSFRSNSKCESITVCQAMHDTYYIQDRVHRAKAAQLACKSEIDAIVYADSKPTGQFTKLENVKVDFY